VCEWFTTSYHFSGAVFVEQRVSFTDMLLTAVCMHIAERTGQIFPPPFGLNSNFAVARNVSECMLFSCGWNSIIQSDSVPTTFVISAPSAAARMVFPHPFSSLQSRRHACPIDNGGDSEYNVITLATIVSGRS
jgi:hypothetical protein